MKQLLSAFAVLSLLSGTALANDTMAELKAGGLIYVQTGEVTMAEEDLYISPDLVRVDYVFRNNGDEDVTSYVAFPMPDITGGPAANFALVDFESDNFMNFTVAQDGKAIVANLQQRVIALGIDQTEEVVARGVPLLPFSDRTMEALRALPPEVLADWTARGLVFDDVYDIGKGMEHHPTPLWTLRSVFWWETTFPAGQDVRVHHEYKPGVGGTAGISFMSEDNEQEEWFKTRVREHTARYCIDSDFHKLASRLFKAMTNQSGPFYTEQWISYVLTTGANWAGPIGRFRLTVDKGSERNYVSFCGTNVRKTGATTFEMTAEDFYPEKDIDILLLVPAE